MKWLEGRRLPRWLVAAVHMLAQPCFHAVAPWAVSLISVRHGWAEGKPGAWNLLGVIPVALGVAIVIWSVGVHFSAAPEGWQFERTRHYPTPAYLLRNGPYRYSRNPMYMGDLTIWLGWVVFYGSLAVLLVFAAISILFGPVVMRREERGLEARFGEAYRAYTRATPRWLGKARL